MISYQRGIYSFVVLAIILFGMLLAGLTTDSFWLDEGWTAWAIHDEIREPQSLRETIRTSLDSLQTTLERVREDVHPPLYFILLDGWSMLAGDSEFALRLPSIFMILLALAGIYGIGTQVFNRPVGLTAMLLLGTSGFITYYAHDARMYALYLATNTLATLAYFHWRHKTSLLHGLMYGVWITLACYTQYVSLLVITAHIIHLLLTIRIHPENTHPVQMIVPFGLAGLLFAPWLPVVVHQFQAHPDGAAANVLASDWNTLAAIWLLLTSGYWLNFVLPFGVGKAFPEFITKAKTRTTITLLLLWLLLPLGGLWIVNARGFAVLQMRYLIATIPAWALLIAYAIDRIHIPLIPPRLSRQTNHAVQIFFIVWLAYTQVSMFDNLWPPKPRWREAIMQAAETRQAREPALMHIDERSPAAYYDRFWNLTEGISINLGWRPFSPQEVTEIAADLQQAQSAWALLPMADPSSWDAIAAFTADRGIGYRDSVQGTIFYRFDRNQNAPLVFTFGEDRSYQWQYQHYAVASSTLLCPNVPNIKSPLIAELALIRGYNEVLVATEEPCLLVPEVDEILHLRLAVLDGNRVRLPLIESGLYWGDSAFLGTVEIED